MLVKLVAVTALVLSSVGFTAADFGRAPCCKKLAPCCTRHCCFAL